jgi:HTH-type transcriptional regulator/antitoxin MqsA
MKCPCCGAAELIHDTRDMPYVYKGETTSIPSVTGEFCPACSEVVLNREHGDRYSELLAAFQRQINSAYVVEPAKSKSSVRLKKSALFDSANTKLQLVSVF